MTEISIDGERFLIDRGDLPGAELPGPTHRGDAAEQPHGAGHLRRRQPGHLAIGGPIPTPAAGIRRQHDRVPAGVACVQGMRAMPYCQEVNNDNR